ncbi:MAG: DUF1028 domain-containing protein [Acetobacteraceae bacterium]|nr:DUF1028 domain-containing protein [Acetobacteraceae bacterium]
MTFSILARDPVSGALGAAVASRFFAVGAICIHVESRVGAMSVQAFPNPLYVRPAMQRLRAGDAPEVILAEQVGPDPGAAHRQFHMLDRDGRSARHTGSGCIDWAGDIGGTDVSVAGNMLAGPDVLPAMLDAFARTEGSPLAERLMSALEGGEAAGGDKRGKQSAGIKVCVDDPYPDLDMRVDDSADPLPELRRLYRVSQERYAVFRRHLPGATSPWGTLDRAIVEADIQRFGRPLA